MKQITVVNTHSFGWILWAALAGVISWNHNHDLAWAIGHAILGPLYLIYALICYIGGC